MPNRMEIPVLETERLVMRAHRPDDFSDCAAMWAEPIVVQFIGGKPFTPEEVWARMLRYAGHWAWMGFGFWAVEERASGRFIGEVGFAYFRRELDSPFKDSPELGWAFITSAHGQGFATEAVRAVVGWGAARFGSTKTIALIDPGNVASIRVAEKTGHHEVHRTSYKGDPTIVFVRSS